MALCHFILMSLCIRSTKQNVVFLLQPNLSSPWGLWMVLLRCGSKFPLPSVTHSCCGLVWVMGRVWQHSCGTLLCHPNVTVHEKHPQQNTAFFAPVKSEAPLGGFGWCFEVETNARPPSVASISCCEVVGVMERVRQHSSGTLSF